MCGIVGYIGKQKASAIILEGLKRDEKGTKQEMDGYKDDVKPEAVYEDLNIQEIDPTQDFTIACDTQLVTVKDGATTKLFDIQGGFADVGPDGFTILAEHAVEVA